jgi:hypothetical protein
LRKRKKVYYSSDEEEDRDSQLLKDLLSPSERKSLILKWEFEFRDSVCIHDEMHVPEEVPALVPQVPWCHISEAVCAG